MHHACTACCLPPVPPQLCDEGACDDDEGEEGVPSYSELSLPASELDGQWEALQVRGARGARHLCRMIWGGGVIA